MVIQAHAYCCNKENIPSIQAWELFNYLNVDLPMKMYLSWNHFSAFFVFQNTWHEKKPVRKPGQWVLILHFSNQTLVITYSWSFMLTVKCWTPREIDMLILTCKRSHCSRVHLFPQWFPLHMLSLQWTKPRLSPENFNVWSKVLTATEKILSFCL